MNIYIILMIVSSIVIVSYLLNIICNRIKLPSVFILLGLGVITQWVFNLYSININYLADIVALLGNLGLILIILESTIELDINKSNYKNILKSGVGAFLIISFTTFL